jgi:hypothetical protein
MSSILAFKFGLGALHALLLEDLQVWWAGMQIPALCHSSIQLRTWFVSQCSIAIACPHRAPIDSVSLSADCRRRFH